MNREAEGRCLAPPSSLPGGRSSRTGRNSLRATSTKEGAADLNTTTGVFSTQGADLIQAYTASEVYAVSRSVDVSSVCYTGSSFAIGWPTLRRPLRGFLLDGLDVGPKAMSAFAGHWAGGDRTERGQIAR